MENNETILLSLLSAKENELKEMLLYIRQLESSYNDLAEKHNKFVEKYYAKSKRKVVGFKQNKK